MKNLRVVALASSHAFDVKWVNYDNLAVPTCSLAAYAARHAKRDRRRPARACRLAYGQGQSAPRGVRRLSEFGKTINDFYYIFFLISISQCYIISRNIMLLMCFLRDI